MNKNLALSLASILILSIVASSYADDYDGGETETAITGLSGLSGLGGLSALANGIVTGYAPSGGEMSNDVVIQGGEGRGLGASESSENESGDYEDDSNDSAASEESPILSKFINFISGGRHRRSVDQSDAPIEPSESKAHTRVKRGYKGWVPYVSTYVKTDKKAHFKWGVSILFLLWASNGFYWIAQLFIFFCYL